MEEKQASFNGWARVEVMGHQTHIGFVRTEAYGQAVMFRIDTPELPERDYVLTEPLYVRVKTGEDSWSSQWTPAGSTVRKVSRPGCSVMVGAGSIYRIMPCTEAAALKAIDQEERAELKLISLPEGKGLPSPTGESEPDEDEYPPIDDEQEVEF
jgi:hypothetical protein